MECIGRAKASCTKLSMSNAAHALAVVLQFDMPQGGPGNYSAPLWLNQTIWIIDKCLKGNLVLRNEP
jgi:hypothetical protein